ncbi:MAG TPA: hypothetical protein PK156_09115, partial [Polyangium sp.]|nr:hypothetical protein [Polyangium sp.]
CFILLRVYDVIHIGRKYHSTLARENEAFDRVESLGEGQNIDLNMPDSDTLILHESVSLEMKST